MLTSYLVKCPHSGCSWFGSLIPRASPEPWQIPGPVGTVLVFHCPQCEGEWLARAVGDDVVPMPVQNTPLEQKA